TRVDRGGYIEAQRADAGVVAKADTDAKAQVVGTRQARILGDDSAVDEGNPAEIAPEPGTRLDRALDQSLAALRDLLAVGIEGLYADRAEFIAADRPATTGEEQLVRRALFDRGTEVASDLCAGGENEAALLAEAVVTARLERAAQRGIAVFELITRPQGRREQVPARRLQPVV